MREERISCRVKRWAIQTTGWRLGLGPGVELTLGALELALCKGAPEIHHSDQGL
jgi:hypothetical protein